MATPRTPRRPPAPADGPPGGPSPDPARVAAWARFVRIALDRLRTDDDRSGADDRPRPRRGAGR